MLAASYWSLLAPAIDIVENSSADKRMSFVPVGIGFIAGGMFVYVADVIMVLKVILINGCYPNTSLPRGSLRMLLSQFKG
jgi:zinc transporter ZupT